MRILTLNFLFVILRVFTGCAQDIGYIEGKISYPGEEIPKDLKVCAENIETSEIICIRVHDSIYKIAVPPGFYYVYAETKKFKGKAYYTEFVKCGLKVDCPSHKKIKVEVKKGELLKNINPQDWYE